MGLASGITGFRSLNDTWLEFLRIILNYLLSPLLLSISHLSLSLNVDFSPAVHRLSPGSKKCRAGHLKVIVLQVARWLIGLNESSEQ